MSKPLFALRKGDVMATVLQWLKQENFHMPAAIFSDGTPCAINIVSTS